MKKCPYTDEQLSVILSAKAGGQLQPLGCDEHERPGEAAGCLNQVVFYNRGLDSSQAADVKIVGKAKKDAAARFDNRFEDSGDVSSTRKVTKISYDQLLRFLGA